MSDSGLLASPARSPFLFVFVGATALVLGIGSDAGSLVALAVGAGVSFVGGCWLLARERIVCRLFGSLATVVGLVGIGASLAFVPGGFGPRVGAGLPVTLGLIATATVAVTAAGCALLPADPFRAALDSSVRQAALAVGLLTPIFGLALGGQLFEWTWWVFRAAPERLSQTPATALLWVQVLVLIGFVVATATETTRGILDRRGYSIPSIAAVYERVREWHPFVYLALLAYGCAWPFSAFRDEVDAAFVALDPVGHLVADVLTNGWPATLLVTAIATMLALSTAGALEPTAREWLEPVPLRTLAGAAGGAVASAGVLAGGWTTNPGGLNSLAAVLCVSAWIAVLAMRLRAPHLARRRLGSRRCRHRLVGLAACSIFGGTLIGAIADLHPVGVVAGVAASLLVWDLGTHGLSMRSAVGADGGVEPVRSHAVVTVLVVAVGAALAVGTLGVSRVVHPSVEASLATAAIGLSLLAVVVLAGGSLPAGSVRGWRSALTRLARLTPAITRLRAIALSIPIWLVLAAATHRGFVLVAIGCVVALAIRSPGRWRRFDDWVDQY